MFEAEQARLAGQTVAGQGSFSSDAADSVTPLSPASEAAAFNSCAAAPASQHSSNGGISASRSSFCSPVSFHLEPTTANAFSSVASPSAAPVEGQNSPVLHANAPSFGGDSSKKTGCHQSTLSSVRLALPDDAVDGEENVTAHRRPFSKRRLQGSPTSSLSSGLPPVLGHVEGRAELLDGDSGAASCCAAVPGCSTAGAADRAVDAPNGVSGKAGGADCPRHFTSLLPAANCGVSGAIAVAHVCGVRRRPRWRGEGPKGSEGRLDVVRCASGSDAALGHARLLRAASIASSAEAVARHNYRCCSAEATCRHEQG